MGTGGLGFTDQGSCLLDALSDGDLHAAGCMLWERWDDQPIFVGSMATQCNSSTVHYIDSMTSISFAKFIPNPDSHTCGASAYPSTMKSWQSAVGHLKSPAKVGHD